MKRIVIMHSSPDLSTCRSENINSGIVTALISILRQSIQTVMSALSFGIDSKFTLTSGMDRKYW